VSGPSFEAIGESIGVRRCAPRADCRARGSVRRIVARALIHGEPVVLGRVGAGVFDPCSARRVRIDPWACGEGVRLDSSVCHSHDRRHRPRCRRALSGAGSEI
jgi:hypothetical protein